MNVLQRVEEIRAGEHMRLRMALLRSTHAIADLKERIAEARRGGQEVDMFGDPVARDQQEQKVNPLARVNLERLTTAWEPFEESLLERVDTWEMDLWPLVRRWTMGEEVQNAVQTVASGMLARRTKLDPLLKEARTQVSFVSYLRAPAVAVFSAIEACDDAEAQVVPALISGRKEVEESSEGTNPLRLSSDVVVRNIRNQARPHYAPPERRTESTGLLESLGRLVGWNSNKR